MAPFAVEVVSEGDLWTDLQHIAIVLGVIGSFFVIAAAIRAWKKERVLTHEARDEATVARAKNEELLKKVSAEFENNHGSSMLDKIEAIGRNLDYHCETAETHFKKQADDLHELKVENQTQHDAIHRRIDGMFELFIGGGANAPRKAAERHKNREEHNDDL